MPQENEPPGDTPLPPYGQDPGHGPPAPAQGTGDDAQHTNPYRSPQRTDPQPPSEPIHYPLQRLATWSVLLLNYALLLTAPLSSRFPPAWGAFQVQWVVWGLPISTGAVCFWRLLAKQRIWGEQREREGFFFLAAALFTFWAVWWTSTLASLAM